MTVGGVGTDKGFKAFTGAVTTGCGCFAGASPDVAGSFATGTTGTGSGFAPLTEAAGGSSTSIDFGFAGIALAPVNGRGVTGRAVS